MARADKSQIELGTLHRSFELRRNTFNKDKRTVDVVFSSETPVARYFGTEVLDHSPGSCDLSRLAAGGSVLMEHDPMMRCGITESARIEGNTGVATLRLARNECGNAALAELEDDTLRFVSVGYRVHKFLVDEETDEYRAVSWEPLEISFVAIPADPTAQVRSGDNKKHTAQIMFKRQIQLDAAPASGGGGTPAPASPAIVTQADFSRELETSREILAIVMQYQRTHPAIIEAGEKAIKDRTPIQNFMRQAMEITRTQAAQDISAPAIGAGTAPQTRNSPKSLGAQIVGSESFKRCVQTRDFKHLNVEIPEFAFRAVLNATTEGIAGTSGANINQIQTINQLGQQQLYVADLFAQGTTNGDQIRIVRESTYTNAATRVAEGSSKPESTLDLEVANFTVEKTAVWQDVTEEMLSDFAQAQSFVNGRIGYMVQALEDQQCITGSGSSQIRGILNTTGIQTLSGATNTIDNMLRAKAYVEGANSAGFANPDAYVINSLDWLSVRLTKDSNGQYLFGGPGYSPYGVGGYSNVGSLWGLPVVSTVSITQGTALVGSFKMGAQIFRRQGLTIKSTNSHASNFISNIVTVLAEQRMALAVYLPNKFCAITGIPAGS